VLKRIAAWLEPILGPIRQRDRTEIALLLTVLAAIVLLLTFFTLAGEVSEGDTQAFDEHVLRALRKADDPSVPVGPWWLRVAARDLTSLGSATVLGVIVAFVIGVLLLQGMRRTALFVLIASVGGSTLNSLLKQFFQRARPDVVPHLSEVMTLSFPSGHAMTSAAVFLTLGALLMRIAERRATKIFCMSAAVFMTVVVGLTRVYLGVHYPTDVLAGWLVGMTWALICWIVERVVERRAGIRREMQQTQG
jgi:undecaprenyl-diphosphatase